MRIYVLRHGQSEANLQVAHAGWSHVPLTEKGLAQARAAAARMHEVHYDKVIVSDLHRAIQTAQCALPDYTYELDWRIRELGVGNLEGRKVADCLREMGEPYDRNFILRDFTDYDGENLEQMQKRVSEFMDDLTKEPEDARIAVVCHEGTMYCMLCHVMQSKLPYLAAFADNCSVCVFTYKGGHWLLNKWNETSSIEPEASSK